LKLEFHRKFFKKYSNIKFHANLSSRSRVVACGRREGRMDRWTWRSWWSLFAVLRTRLKYLLIVNITTIT